MLCCSDLWTATLAVYLNGVARFPIRRGRGIVERLYPNAAQRRRLSQFGFAPVVGRRFELMAPAIRAELVGAERYGASTSAERIALFERLGTLIRNQPGLAFEFELAFDTFLTAVLPNPIADDFIDPQQFLVMAATAACNGENGSQRRA